MFAKKITMCMILMVLWSLLAFGSIATAETKYTIAVVVHGSTTDPFWKIAEKGLHDIAGKYPDLEVSYHGPKMYNLEEFLYILRSVIVSQPDALICPLTSPMRMDEILRPAIAEGLPVIAIHIADMREPAERRIPVLTYIGEDSYMTGVIAAQETLQRFTPQRAIFCNHDMESERIDALGRGWIETMKTHGIPAEQLDVTAGADLGTGILAAYLLNHPDTNAIFTVDVERTLAFIIRLGADGYNVGEDIRIAQMDVEPLVLDYIENGKSMFTLDQQPYLQTYLSVLLGYVHLKYGFTPSQRTFIIEPGIITQENIADRPGFTVPNSLLENLRSEGIPDNILQDLQSLNQ